jgi:hypothetical protein
MRGRPVARSSAIRQGKPVTRSNARSAPARWAGHVIQDTINPSAVGGHVIHPHDQPASDLARRAGHAIQRDPTRRAGYAIQDAINQHLHGTMGRPRDPARPNSAPGRLRDPGRDQPASTRRDGPAAQPASGLVRRGRPRDPAHDQPKRGRLATRSIRSAYQRAFKGKSITSGDGLSNRPATRSNARSAQRDESVLCAPPARSTSIRPCAAGGHAIQHDPAR